MLKKILCTLLAATLLFSLCGCKKNTAEEYSSEMEVEVIYQYDDTSEAPTDTAATDSSTVSGGKKPTASAAAPTASTPAGTASSTPAQSTTAAVTGKNTRPYLGSATVADGRIDVNDPHVYFSPYNWYNGGSYRLNTVCGGYVKIAFTGSYFALGVDTSAIGGNDPASFLIHCYIDSAVKYSNSIEKTLADASDGKIVFADKLSAGTHYATVFLSRTGTGDAWFDGAPNSLRINGFYINAGEQIVDLADTENKVKPRRIIFYGDSITEGDGIKQGGEYCYAALLAKQLNAEYGQLGDGGIGWTKGGCRTIPNFYFSDDKYGYWRYYFYGASRFNGDNISSGYIDGAPDAIFINMGTNDTANADLDNMMSGMVSNLCTDWLYSTRSAVDSDTEIFVIVPFNYGKEESVQKIFKKALLEGVSSYCSAVPTDTRVHTLDLGSEGFKIVKNNSTDTIHPNEVGSVQLTNKLYDQVKKYMQ